MADLLRTIKVLLAGEDVNLNKTMINAGKDFDKFSSNVQNVTGPLGDFGKKVALAEAALISMVTYGLVKAVQASADFQAGFLEITTLVDDTGESVDNFRGDILNYAGDSVKSIEDINGAVYSAISAGVDYKDSIEVLGAAEKLSVAGKAELKDSLVSLVSSLNAYGAGSEEAAKYADYLFTTVKLGQTTLPELNQSLSQVTNIAAAAGVGFDEIAAAIAAITATGAPTAEAITYIKGAITSILKPSAEASAAAEKLGIDFTASALKSKGLAGVLDEVKTATGGNTEEMAKLFGNVRALNAALTLTGAGADKFEESLEAMKDSTGAVSVAFEKMQEDVKLQFQGMLNNIDIALIQSGSKVEAGAADIVSGFSEIFKALGAEVESGTFDEIFDAINEFFGDTETLLKEVAKNLPEALAGVDFSSLVESLKGLGVEVGEALDALFGGELDLSTVEGLEGAIQIVIDTVTLLTNVTTGFLDGLQPKLTVIGEAIEKFRGMDVEGQKLAGDVLGWADSIGSLFSALDTLKAVLIGLAGVSGLNAVASSISLFASIKPESLAAIKTGVAGIGTSISQLVGALAGLVGAGALGWEFGRFIGEFNDGAIDNAVQDFYAWADSLITWGDEAAAAQNKGDGFNKTIKEIREEALTKALIEVGIEITGSETFEELQAKYDNFQNPEPIEIIIESEQAGQSLDDLGLSAKELEAIEIKFEDGSWDKFSQQTKEMEGQKELEVIGYFNGEEVLGEINDTVPEEKIIEVKPTILEQAKIELERDLATIEASAETVQTAMEWEAKIDIAQIEADAKVMESAFDSVSESVSATAGAVADMFSSFVANVGDLDFSDKWFAMDQLEAELEIQTRQVEMQEKLIDAQVKYMEMRNQAAENGDGFMKLTVDDSVTPALKAFMFEIVNLMQIESTAMYEQYLLGLPA